MSKKMWSVLVAGAMIASVFSALPAQAAAEIPAEVQIDDPFGDANGLNDQGQQGSSVQGNSVPWIGNHETPSDASTTADIGKVWFTNTSDSITANMQLEVPLGGSAPTYSYDIFANPGEGSVAANTFWCLRFHTLIPGSAQGQPTTWHDEPVVKVLDRCNVGPNFWNDSQDGEFELSEVDGTGVLSMTFPRSYSPLLADGSKLERIRARTVAAVGLNPEDTGFVTTVQIDNTDFGIDYEITSDGGGVVVTPPVVQEPPVVKPKTKNCNKIKNKKKRQKCKKQQKQKKPQGCAAYVPGELGAEVEEETILVTDKATVDAPMEIELEFAPAAGSTPTVQGQGIDTSAHILTNVQVDSKASETGFWARLESPEADDPDLYVYWDNGREAARAAGFNQALVAGPLPDNPFINLNGTGNGGHSELGAEQIDGLRTSKCAGWTLDLSNWLGEGGTYTLKLWLGEIENDPAPRDA